jgi:hypothetical protein
MCFCSYKRKNHVDCRTAIAFRRLTSLKSDVSLSVISRLTKRYLPKNAHIVLGDDLWGQGILGGPSTSKAKHKLGDVEHDMLRSRMLCGKKVFIVGDAVNSYLNCCGNLILIDFSGEVNEGVDLAEPDHREWRITNYTEMKSSIIPPHVVSTFVRRERKRDPRTYWQKIADSVAVLWGR